jgi:hypothetical protein
MSENYLLDFGPPLSFPGLAPRWAIAMAKMAHTRKRVMMDGMDVGDIARKLSGTQKNCEQVARNHAPISVLGWTEGGQFPPRSAALLNSHRG